MTKGENLISVSVFKDILTSNGSEISGEGKTALYDQLDMTNSPCLQTDIAELTRNMKTFNDTYREMTNDEACEYFDVDFVEDIEADTCTRIEIEENEYLSVYALKIGVKS
jgi:hypothetical protein